MDNFILDIFEEKKEEQEEFKESFLCIENKEPKASEVTQTSDYEVARFGMKY